METHKNEPEILIPDEVIDTRFDALFESDRGAARPIGNPPPITRRQKIASTLLLIVLAFAALAVASVVAVGAIIVATVLFVVGLIVRLAMAISGKTDR